MAREVDALMVWDLTELGNGVLEVVETAAWLHAQGVYLYARQPDGMETHDVRGRARLELIGHLAEFQAGIQRERLKAHKPARSRGVRKPHAKCAGRTYPQLKPGRAQVGVIARW
jgi:hypothetical protein